MQVVSKKENINIVKFKINKDHEIENFLIKDFLLFGIKSIKKIPKRGNTIKRDNILLISIRPIGFEPIFFI